MLQISLRTASVLFRIGRVLEHSSVQDDMSQVVVQLKGLY